MKNTEMEITQYTNGKLMKVIDILSKELEEAIKKHRTLEAEIERKDMMISAIRKELLEARQREQLYKICCMGDR